MWPLRLQGGWFLCQSLHYDVTGWYWVLDHDGDVLSLDTLDDKSGIGRYGFPTAFVFEANSATAEEAARGAYLTIKRLHKRIRTSEEWQRIGRLARQNPRFFRSCLETIVGYRCAAAISRSVFDGRAPEARLSRRALRAQRLRRYARSDGGIRLLVLAVRRVFERVSHPTGLIVLIAGPDGAGKSTLAESILDNSYGLFRRTSHVHWRPGLLPAPAAVMRRPAPDATRPHEQRPHGRWLSLALLAYQWADFVVGGLKLRATRVRSGLVVWERGWSDLAVDPARYRLRVPPRLIGILGSIVPKPDVVLLLEAPASVLLQRKAELGADELERQMAAWRALPRRVRRFVLDARMPPQQVVSEARGIIIGLLEARAVGRLAAGWTTLPGRETERWLLPRGPRDATMQVLRTNRPEVGLSRVLWGAAQSLVQVGGGRLLPRAGAPPRRVREVVARYVRRGDSIAVTRRDDWHSCVAQILASDGACRFVAKVATDEEGRRLLSNEVEALKSVDGRLAAPLVSPRVIEASEGFAIFEGVSPVPRTDPSKLSAPVAYALGRLFALGRNDREGVTRGFSHGDCAPWNLVDEGSRLVLVNWEAATTGALPFVDVFHYLLEAHAVLGRPSPSAVFDGLSGVGWVGTAIEAYAKGAGVGTADAEKLLVEYLADVGDPDVAHRVDERRMRARKRLLVGLGR